jgi:hypothetical protein
MEQYRRHRQTTVVTPERSEQPQLRMVPRPTFWATCKLEPVKFGRFLSLASILMKLATTTVNYGKSCSHGSSRLFWVRRGNN